LLSHKLEDIAVLIPCLNEEKTIGKVIRAFREALPEATIYVFDNRSTDRTAEIAEGEGAVVVFSHHRGKGNVIRHMFRDVEADIYVMVDGDDTYPAASAPELIQELKRTASDMVVGMRLAVYEETSFRRFHKFGNRLVTGLISGLFKVPVEDVMSGYRVFTRDFVKSIPLTSGGFEVETEMTLQAAAKKYKILERPVEYRSRPEGSFSKLNTFSDGLLVLKTIFLVFRNYKPFSFFALLSLLLGSLSISAGILPIYDYYAYKFVYHVPLAILSAGLGILAALSLGIGFMLDTIIRYHNETFALIRRQGPIQ